MKKPKSKLKVYFLNILVSIDQFLNTITGGDEDETVSSRVGKMAENNSKFGLFMEKIIDYMFGKGHCRKHIENDEGKNSVL